MNTRSIITATLSLAVASPLLGEVVVTDLGSAPTDFQTGYTGDFFPFVGMLPGRNVAQTFTLDEGVILQSICIGYRSFDNFNGPDTSGMLTLFVDGGNDGSFEIRHTVTLHHSNFSGNRFTDPSFGDPPPYWMKWDVSALGVELPAGESKFQITVNSLDPWNSSTSSWLFATCFGRSNPYPDGEGSASSGLSSNSDMCFAVTGTPTDDTDGDDLPDTWELSFPGVSGLGDLNGTLAAGSGPGSGTGDFDGDGLSDSDEFDKGADPTLGDTDGDGLSDGDEANGTLNPYRTGHVAGNPPAGAPGMATDPVDGDSDDDGILDNEEVMAGDDGFITNPNAPDTDGDTMTDDYEAANNAIAPGLDPTDPTDPGNDLDGDGLSNLAEFNPLAGPNPQSPQTRADNPDTDGDGYNDMVEDNAEAWFNETATGSNPVDSDTDGDGLPDGNENPATGTAGGPVYGSNPNIFDSDGDFYGDGDEAAAGTLLNDPASVPTGIPVRSIDFSSNDGGWVNMGGTTLEAAPELIPGLGGFARIDGFEIGNGVSIPIPNPAGHQFVYTSVDVRIDGTGGPGAQSGSYVFTLGGDQTVFRTANTNCVLDMGNHSFFLRIGDTSYGRAFEQLTEHVTYTVQIALHLPTNTWDVQAYDHSTGMILFSDVGLAATPGSSGTSDPLYFNIGIKPQVQATWDLAVDNVIVSLDPIPITQPDRPLEVTEIYFNGNTYEISAIGLDPSKTYNLVRGTDLVTFPDIVDTLANPFETDVFVDSAPAGQTAYYRIEEASP